MQLCAKCVVKPAETTREANMSPVSMFPASKKAIWVRVPLCLGCAKEIDQNRYASMQVMEDK